MVECNASTHVVAEIFRRISAEESIHACYPCDVLQPQHGTYNNNMASIVTRNYFQHIKGVVYYAIDV